MLKIGGIAKRAEINIETVRYYERIGLMPDVGRTQNGYRSYDDSHLKRLIFIRRGRDLGFSIASIKNLLEISEDSSSRTRAEVKSLTQEHILNVRGKIANLQQLEQVLNDLAKHCDGKHAAAKDCPILNALVVQE